MKYILLQCFLRLRSQPVGTRGTVFFYDIMHEHNDDTTRINIYRIVKMTQSDQKHTFFPYNRQNADNIPNIIIVR